MSDYNKRWAEAVKESRSLVIAGADPIPGTPNLPEWAEGYVEEVGPHVAGIKPNPNFYRGSGGREALEIISEYARENGKLVIDDSKLRDIGSTNKAGILGSKELGFDGITIAPYAGNIEETVKMIKAKDVDMGVVMMGLMSNPQFRRRAMFVSPETGKELWQHDAEEALHAGADSFVLGGTYKKEDRLFQRFVELMREEDVTFLVPGLGSGQGGDFYAFIEAAKELGIDPKRLMLNVGTGLMYPKGRSRADESQALQEVCQGVLESEN
jgi:orotidine-5'-phosphate decarboxylase